MRPNVVKRLISDGGRAVNAWCSIPSPYTAEVVSQLGFDSVTIDLQHGAIDYTAAFSMLQAISTTPAPPIVRAPWNEPGILMKLLDAGAYGVICPMINSRADAEAFVGSCRYPPLGFRSIGPNRAIQYAGADYAEHANSEILLLAMIETESGVKNLEEILAVPGLDGTYVGPGDLSLAFGQRPSMTPADEHLKSAIRRVREKTQAAGLVAAIHTDGPQTALQRFAEGFQMCTLQSDVRFLATAAAAALREVKGTQK